MQPAPLPDNEEERIVRLMAYGVLDTLPQQAFDDITALASSICATPIALISLIDRDRQWFKSRVGLDVPETEREIAFCSHAILQPGEMMEVKDATLDPRFHDNPLVSAAPDIRFYAGAPIVTPDGLALGTVCVIDRAARSLSQEQRQSLRALANLVADLLEQEKLRREVDQRTSAAARFGYDVLLATSNTSLDLKSFVDRDLVYRFVNSTYLKYWNRTPEEIINHPVVDLLGQDVFDRLARPNLERALAGETVHLESQLVKFSAMGKRYVDVFYLPARDAAGKIMGVVVRIEDMQQRKERDDQLRNTVIELENKTLEQERFIHIISHDLREPINTINNFSSLLAEDDGLKQSATARRYLNFVQAGGQRMGQLLNELLNFVRLDKHVLTRKTVDLASISAQVREDLNAAITRTGGRVEVGHLPEYQGDASLLRIALQNLVSNGLKFSRKGVPPVIQISAQVSDQDVKLYVQDNGIGMPHDQLDKVFDLFKRLHLRKEYSGSGLGLSICRRIAELHGGSVTVTSELDQGSCFTLTLPRQTVPLKGEDGHEHL